MNYDAWFDYIEIVEGEGNADVIRDVYERAIANIPPTKVCNLGVVTIFGRAEPGTDSD